MLEFIGFLIVFLLIFRLQKDVELLKREVFFLKREKELLQTQNVASPPAHIPMQTFETEEEASSENLHQTRQNTQNSFFFHLSNTFGTLFKSYFTTGNSIVRIGGVVLFFGLAFLAKYALEHSIISIQVRLLFFAFVACVLLGVGWHVRTREGHYGLILQGLGIAVLYLVIFSSAKLYLFISFSTAFVAMLCIVLVGVILSVVQNALALALFSIAGGFLTPILTSDANGSHVALFGYYALLNLGIVLIAWFRSWRLLNLTGFFFTFAIAAAWGVLQYKSAYLLSSELFLALFYFFYLIVSLLFTYKQEFCVRAPLDATLVFGLPVIVFSYQVSLVGHIEYALACSAFAFGCIYSMLYLVLRKYDKFSLLARSFLALGILFYTVTLPYVFDSRLSATLWALEGAAVVYIALRQEQTLARYFGQILVLVATVVYVLPSNSFREESFAFFNTEYLGYIFLIGANLFCAYLLDKNKVRFGNFDKNNFVVFLFIGMILWLLSGLDNAQFLGEQLGNTMLLYLAFWGSVFGAVSYYFRWRNMKLLLQGYFILGTLFLIGLIEHYAVYHPFESIGSVALIGFFTVHYFLLYLFDVKWKIQPYLHLFSFWIVILLVAWEAHYVVSIWSVYAAWQCFSWMGTVMLGIYVLLYRNNFLPPFFHKYTALYKSAGLSGLIVMLFISFLYSFNLDGSFNPGYITFLNPLELLACGVFYLFYVWIIKQDAAIRKPFITLFALLALLFLSVMLARSIHAYVGVEYTLNALLHSRVFQMGISVLWGLIALGVILASKYFQHRLVWMAGASLIGVVVVKLFLIELSKSGSIERIISFIVVGIFLLLIGYFAPLPPKEKA